VSRDALIEALWPDPDAVAAATSLKVAMHGLRQALRDAESADLRVIAHGAGYQLCTPRVWVDVEEFERLHGLGRRVERSDPPSALALYARAVELYRGDLLADGLDHWILVRRELLKDQQLMMLGKLADAALADGDYAECISRCCQILNQDRCREDAYRALMLCYARLNQPTRVRRRYELCVQGLRTYLDTDPEPATIKLYESLRAR